MAKVRAMGMPSRKDTIVIDRRNGFMRRRFANLAARFLALLGCVIIFSIIAGAAPDVPASIKELHNLTTLPSASWKYTTENNRAGRARGP